MQQIAIELFISMSKVVKYYARGQLSFMVYIKMRQSKFKKEEHFKSFIFMSLFCITTSEQLSLVHRIDVLKHPVLDINDHGVIKTHKHIKQS